MTGFKKLFLTVGFVAVAMGISGCESIDTAMHNVKERFASMDMDMPKVTPTNKGYAHKDNLASKTAPEKTNIVITKTEAKTVPKETMVTITTGKDCPPVSAIKELDSMHQFTNPERPTPSGKISSITLTELKTACKYNKNNVVVEIDLKFEGKLGPRAKIWNTDRPSFAYPYFMAITTPNGNIVAKEVFAATISYDKYEQSVIHEESLRQIIPLNGEFNKKHAILIGFQLTEGELAYNRALKNIKSAASIETAAGTEIRTIKPISITPPRKPQKVVIKETAKEEIVVKIETIEEDSEDSVVKAPGLIIEDTMVHVESEATSPEDSMIIVSPLPKIETPVEGLKPEPVEMAVPALVAPEETPSAEPMIIDITADN